MIADEGGYAYATRGWLNGTGQLYDDLWISRPQGIFYLYAFIFDTLGTDVVAFRLAAWLSACATTVAVWLIARRWRPNPVPILAALIFTLGSASPKMEGFTANAEMFMMLPAAWSIWTLIKAIDTGWSARWVVSTGILVGIATMVKPSGIVMLPVALVAIFAMNRTSAGPSWRVPAAWLLAGVAAVGIPALIHGWFLGWGDFLYATVTYRLTMQSGADVPLITQLQTLARHAWNSLPFLLMAGVLVAVVHRAALAAVLRRYRAAGRWAPRFRGYAILRNAASRLIGAPAYPHLAAPDDRVGMLLRLWMLGSLAGIAMGGDWWTHYFIQIVAPVSIWLASIIVRALRSVRPWTRRALATAIVLVLVSPWWIVFLGSTNAVSNYLYSHPGYQAQAEVATWLQEHSEPGTRVFVAFDQAAIYYLADRPPAYRHLYDQELRALPESYSEIITIIRGPDRPLYIVSTRQPGPYPDESRTFWQEVGRYYDLETMIDGIPVYRARDYTPPAPS